MCARQCAKHTEQYSGILHQISEARSIPGCGRVCACPVFTHSCSPCIWHSVGLPLVFHTVTEGSPSLTLGSQVWPPGT